MVEITAQEWKEKSERGEVCGILGCHGKPVVRCPHCGNHYCEEHSFVIDTPAHAMPVATHEEVKQKEGWGFPAGSRKAHYFVDSMSLCRRWGFYYGSLEPGKDGSPDNCPACMKALIKRRRY